MADNNMELDANYQSTDAQDKKSYKKFAAQFIQYQHLLTDEEMKMWFAVVKELRVKGFTGKKLCGHAIAQSRPTLWPNLVAAKIMFGDAWKNTPFEKRLRDRYPYANLERDWPNMELLTGVETLAPPKKLEAPKIEISDEQPDAHSISFSQAYLGILTSRLEGLEEKNEALKERVQSLEKQAHGDQLAKKRMQKVIFDIAGQVGQVTAILDAVVSFVGSENPRSSSA